MAEHHDGGVAPATISRPRRGMSVENEVQQLRSRVSELERRLDAVYAHIGLSAVPLPGTKAATVSPEVRGLISEYRIVEAMSTFARESDGAEDLSPEMISRIFTEETGKPFEAKRAR